ncbi:dicarboxylate/amino acid:cation symporter [Sphingomonas sp. GlSt437]|uniref:dicarboxylate/amino acid:cation symporter n=1 Tax=Sphingomonas sp. GlSt437 TaxID=3389970 RepID=UPI003A84637C
MSDTATNPPTGRSGSLPFSAQIAIGMALGLGIGLVARLAGGDWLAGTDRVLQTIGDSFVQLLKAVVAPLVVTAIIASVAALRDVRNGGRLVAETLLWFAITAAIAVTIGLTLATIIEPGAGSTVPLANAVRPTTTGGWLDFLKGLIPSNFLGLTAATHVADGAATTAVSLNVLQLIVIAIAVGTASVSVGEAGKPFLTVNAALLSIFRRILTWIVRLTPIGSAALIGHAVLAYGWATLGLLGSFALTVYAGLAIVLFGVYPLLLRLNGVSLPHFVREAWPPVQLAFVTRSSIATLPVTEQAAERLGIDRAYAAFAVPFAATTKMDGCAGIYPAAAAIFIAQYYHLPLGVGDYLLILLVSVVGSAATAGLTGALVMLTLTLSTLGLPLEGAGLLLAIDPILDMGRTAVNVAGQLVTTTIVARRRGLLAPIPQRVTFAATAARPDLRQSAAFATPLLPKRGH